MNRLTHLLLLLVIATLGLAACQPPPQPEPDPAPEMAPTVEDLPDTAVFNLAGTSWILSSLNGEAPLADVPVSLEFGTDGTAFGTDGCNRFNTSYTQDGANLTISPSGALSMMACEDPIMAQAATYMDALTSATTFIATPMQLTLLNDTSGETLATFAAGTLDEAGTEAPPVVEADPPVVVEGDLAGTAWILSALDGALPLAGTAVTIQFDTEGNVTGSDGCNRIMSSFTQDGNNLSIGPSAGTMMMCEEEVMAQAAAFGEALAATDNFIMADRNLVLRAGNQNLATFVADSQDLTDTAWEVVAYNNGREAVVGLIAGTQIDAYFGDEDDLTGNAGCNDYFTDFTTDDDNNITLGTIGATMRFCAEPVGLMTQEAEYLAALERATTYRVEGNTLQMRTADDQLAVIMARKQVVELPTPEANAPQGRVTAPQGLNVRSGPGVNFPIIGYAPFGTEGEIVGRSLDNRWWAASAPSLPNGIGWVSAEFVVAFNTQDVPVIEVAPPPVIVPTLAPTPTPPPAPTATPLPELSFGADRTNIQAGECTTLRWSVNNVRGVWVYPQGERFEQFPRAGQGTEQVCPTNTTTYEMRVHLLDGSIIFRQVTINVAGSVSPLAGTRWEVINFNNGMGALVTVLADTRLTIEFGLDGQVNGTSGCNSYFANYRSSGNLLTIDPPAGTTLLCPEPEGVMEQEQQFQQALSMSSTFRLDGNVLEIRTAGGQISVVAARLP